MGGLGVGLGRSGGAGGRPGALALAWLESTCSKQFRTCSKQTIKQTNNQTNKQSINQTNNQANKQSIKPSNKQRTQKTQKKTPYIKKLATPDRPPPAAAMLIRGFGFGGL